MNADFNESLFMNMNMNKEESCTRMKNTADNVSQSSDFTRPVRLTDCFLQLLREVYASSG